MVGGLGVALISASIKDLRKTFIKNGYADSVFDINNGECEAFASDLVELLEKRYGKKFVEDYELEVVEYGDFTGEKGKVNDFNFHKSNLEAINVPLPVEFTLEQVNKANISGHGDHYFLMGRFDGNLYFFDSMNDSGSRSFLDMFMSRYLIAGYNEMTSERDRILTVMKSINP